MVIDECGTFKYFILYMVLVTIKPHVIIMLAILCVFTIAKLINNADNVAVQQYCKTCCFNVLCRYICTKYKFTEYLYTSLCASAANSQISRVLFN